jgi:hypothetical protein
MPDYGLLLKLLPPGGLLFEFILLQTITMNASERKDDPVGGNNARGEQPDAPLRTQEKTSLGGEFNSGVTSNDPAEKDEIEKKGALANIDQSSVRSEPE